MDDNEDPNLDGDEIQAQIGKQLRAMYDNVLSEPIPDRLVELLIQLDDIQISENRDRSKQQ